MARSHRHGRGRDSLPARDARGEANLYRRENATVRQWTREARRAADAHTLARVRIGADPEAEAESFVSHRGTCGWETW